MLGHDGERRLHGRRWRLARAKRIASPSNYKATPSPPGLGLRTKCSHDRCTQPGERHSVALQPGYV